MSYTINWCTFLKTPGIFRFLDLAIFGNIKVKNTGPWKHHMIFLNISRNPTSFLIDPWDFHMPFIQNPWKLHVLHSPYMGLNFFVVTHWQKGNVLSGTRNRHKMIFRKVWANLLRKRWSKSEFFMTLRLDFLFLFTDFYQHFGMYLRSLHSSLRFINMGEEVTRNQLCCKIKSNTTTTQI